MEKGGERVVIQEMGLSFEFLFEEGDEEIFKEGKWLCILNEVVTVKYFHETTETAKA